MSTGSDQRGAGSQWPGACYLLAVNGGSSTIKLALFEVGSGGVREFARERLALLPDEEPAARQVRLRHVVTTLIGGRALHAVAHRLVYPAPALPMAERLSNGRIATFRAAIHLAPEHLPRQLELVEELQRLLPDVESFACHDTAFHQSLPIHATLLALPANVRQLGVRRYGFHGLSFAYLTEQLAAIDGGSLRGGRVILAHIGSGVSLAAVRNGSCVDTTMSFSPSGGLPMATRSGDLDPGIASFVIGALGIAATEFRQLINERSGLLGLSGISGDVQQLLAVERSESAAAEALAVYVHALRKQLGAFVAVLGGLDRLVFSGGVGEHSAELRRRICANLECFGLELDPEQNACHAARISRRGAVVEILVVPTNEESMMAKAVARLLGVDASVRGAT